MRAQIAFDYLIVFIFVLLVFTIVFYAISKQRVEAATQQSFAQLQLVGQTIASEITAASQFGNGYSAQLPLPGAISLLQYNVSITRQGGVIVSSNAFGELVSTYSPTYATLIVSDPSHLSSSGQYYSIPTYTSNGYITIENSYGVVCIDYACPTSLSQPSQLSVQASTIHALRFNGANTGLQLHQVSSLGQHQTVSMWIYPYQSAGTSQVLYDEGSQSANLNWMSYQSDVITAGTQAGAGNSCTSIAPVLPDKWYLLTFTTGPSGLSLYVDGSIAAGCSASGAIGSQSNSISIGMPSYSAGGVPFNGMISNVQLYGSTLTAQNVMSIWAAGISGSPLQQQSNVSNPIPTPLNLSAWWPLGGDALDYSGNGYNLVFEGTGTFVNGAELQATVRNYTGARMPGSLVDFSSGSGPSTAWSYNGILDSKGTVSAFLAHSLPASGANIKVTVFSGNASAANSLAAWWPLNEGQGSVAYDGAAGTSTGAPNGNILGASWASPNYVLSLNGRNGYVQLPNPAGLQLSTETISGWLYLEGHGSGRTDFLFSKQGAYDVGVCGSDYRACYYDWGSGTTHVSNAILSTGEWYMLTATINGGVQTVYVNGVKVLSGPAGASSQAYGPRIGYGTQGLAFNGSISNVQVYSTAFSQQQIYALYQEGTAAPPMPNLAIAGWWPLDGDTLDYSGNGYNGTAYGSLSYLASPIAQYNATQTLTAGFSGGSFAYGSGSNLDSQQLTVSAWISPWIGGSACGTIFSALPANAISGYELGVNTISSQTYFDYATQSGIQSISFPGTSYPANTWYYVAVTFDNGTTSLYINGVLANTTANANKAIQYSQSGWSIGSQLGRSNCGFDGQIANVQVYGSALSGTQISRLYSQGGSAFPLPSASLESWWPLNGNTNDYGPGDNNGFPYVIAYYAQSFPAPYATASMSRYGLYFNGYGSNVFVGNSIVLTGPSISVSAWVYPAYLSNGNEQAVVGQAGAYQLAIGSAGNSEADFMVYSGGRWISAYASKPLVPGSWYLLTGVYNTTKMLIYVDGRLAAETSVTGSFSDPGLPTIIGSDYASPYNTHYFNGTIADVQAYNTQLSAQQIGQLYSNGMPISVTATVPLGVTT